MAAFFAIPIVFLCISVFYLIYYVKKNTNKEVQSNGRFGKMIRDFKDKTEFFDRRNDLHYP